MSLVDEDSLAKVGTVVAVATGEVYHRDWQRWAAAVGDHNPLWFNPEYARAHGYRDIICPLHLGLIRGYRSWVRIVIHHHFDRGGVRFVQSLPELTHVDKSCGMRLQVESLEGGAVEGEACGSG